MKWILNSTVVFVVLVQNAVSPPPLISKKNEEKIIPDVHMPGVRMERDGDLNTQFRQEVILSVDEDFDVSNSKQLGEAIRKMFNESDTNGDQFLSADELLQRINGNMLSHIFHSTKQAADRQKLIDANMDGFITWEEYSPQLIMDDSHQDEDGNHVLTKDESNRIEDERRGFFNSDENRDGKLDSLEWLSFLHPEQSQSGLMNLAEDIVKSYDKNNDSVVSIDEFVNGVPGSVDEENEMFSKMEQTEKEKRRREFIDDIDIDGDGGGTIVEFYEYINPKNSKQGKSEVNEIMMLVDLNEDGKLSLNELLDRDWLLATSALLSARRKLHDEM